AQPEAVVAEAVAGLGVLAADLADPGGGQAEAALAEEDDPRLAGEGEHHLVGPLGAARDRVVVGRPEQAQSHQDEPRRPPRRPPPRRPWHPPPTGDRPP